MSEIKKQFRAELKKTADDTSAISQAASDLSNVKNSLDDFFYSTSNEPLAQKASQAATLIQQAIQALQG